MKPVVTAVNGYCCAGGWHFVNDTDVVLCSVAERIARHPLGILTTTVETIWTAVQQQRSAAEAFGLAMLARSDASVDARGGAMREFVHKGR